MTKEEAIRKAYGIHFEKCKSVFVDENGWTCSTALLDSKDTEHEVKYENFSNKLSVKWYRPISLKGIENNNGWIKIESENDLPKDEREGYETGKFEDDEFHIDQFRVSASRVKNLWNWGKITHFKPVHRTKPLY